jgi:hypothetical protein
MAECADLRWSNGTIAAVNKAMAPIIIINFVCDILPKKLYCKQCNTITDHKECQAAAADRLHVYLSKRKR